MMNRVTIILSLRVLGFSMIALISSAFLVQADPWTGIFRNRTSSVHEIVEGFNKVRPLLVNRAIVLNAEDAVDIVSKRLTRSDLKHVEKLNKNITRFLAGGSVNKKKYKKALDKLTWIPGRAVEDTVKRFKVWVDQARLYKDNKVIGQYPKGTNFIATAVKGEWVMVTFKDGKNAWIALADLNNVKG